MTVNFQSGALNLVFLRHRLPFDSFLSAHHTWARKPSLPQKWNHSETSDRHLFSLISTLFTLVSWSSSIDRVHVLVVYYILNAQVGFNSRYWLHCNHHLVLFYRLQTKFAKVMFSQVSVCPQGAFPIACWDTHPVGRHPSRQAPPWADTPLGRPAQPDTTLDRHPLRHPPGQCMLGYGQQAGGTHPTGMHSCSWILCFLWQKLKIFKQFCEYINFLTFIIFVTPLVQKNLR